jgi:hypothetical protein
MDILSIDIVEILHGCSLVPMLCAIGAEPVNFRPVLISTQFLLMAVRRVD